MSGHEVLTLALSVVFSVVFVILSVMVVHAIRSLSKATPVTANQAAAPLRIVPPRVPPREPPRRPARRKKNRDEIELLPADATVTFAAERSAADIDDVFEALDRDLIGLFPVKQKVQEIAALLLVDRARNKFGLSAPRPNLHMCFTGPPGTGKTTVALRMAELLHRLGYIEKGHLVHAMRDDLVAEYIGQTAPKTKRVLDRAMGGVLFIDEAYYLYRQADSKDYGQEVIDILLQVMENERDKLVVILAGYKDRMDEFFGVNPGMNSRIAHHLDFEAYQLDELVSIVKSGKAVCLLCFERDQACCHRSRIAEIVSERTGADVVDLVPKLF